MYLPLKAKLPRNATLLWVGISRDDIRDRRSLVLGFKLPAPIILRLVETTTEQEKLSAANLSNEKGVSMKEKVSNYLRQFFNRITPWQLTI